MNSKSSLDAKVKRSSQGQLILYHGMTLSQMWKVIQLKPSLRWSKAIRIGLLPGWGIYNSTFSVLENLSYNKKISQTELAGPPIFLLGYWRSGTTLLHNLMGLDQRYAFPNLYQTLFPSHFLTTETVFTAATGWMVPKSRPMDNVEVHWKVPQEDEFAICCLSMVSPYTLPLRPFDLDEWRRSFRIDSLSPEDRKRWEDAVLYLMKKLTIKYQKPLIMKSPSHTYRVKAILKLFPDAKFVHITRHPFDVFNSTLHLRKTMIEENTLGDPYHPDAENNVITTMLDAHEIYQEEKKLIPEGHLAELRYEDLCENPTQEIQRIYDELSLGEFESVRSRIQTYKETNKNYKKNRFDQDPHWQQVVYERLKQVYEMNNYLSPQDEKRQSVPA